MEATRCARPREETGLACRILAPLGEIVYAKTPQAGARRSSPRPLVAPAATVLPPGDWEVDRVEFHTADEARARLHPDQRPFVDRAVVLESEPAPG